MIWSPLTAITILQLLSILCSNFIDVPDFIYTIVPFFVATSITPIITFKKPYWISEWYKNNELALLLLQLEHVTNQLGLVKNQLVQIEEKQVIPTDEEIIKLHSFTKFLIKLSQVTKEQITNISESK
jgi:hypothetical protein